MKNILLQYIPYIEILLEHSLFCNKCKYIYIHIFDDISVHEILQNVHINMRILQSLSMYMFLCSILHSRCPIYWVLPVSSGGYYAKTSKTVLHSVVR